MRRLLALFFIIFILLGEGCFFGTFQTADTLGPGEIAAGWYINYPLYFSKQDKIHSKEDSLGAYVTPNIGGYLAYGAADFADFGLKASLGEGFGPFGKIKFLDESYGLLSGAVLLSMGYHPVAQGISLRSDILFSKKLSPFSSIYFGWTGVRSPDYRRVAYEGIEADEIQDFKFFQALFLGVDLRRKSFEDPRLEKFPFGLTMEFTVPLTRYPALFFGIQLKR